MSTISVPAISVNQWLSSWENVGWEDTDLKRKPIDNQMLMFSISARKLKKLSGVFRREVSSRSLASEDFGIQRKHDPERSKIIREYVQNGYPWSELGATKRNSGVFDDLKKPGWLPTAIVLNILTEKDERRKQRVHEDDLIKVEDGVGGIKSIVLPSDLTDPDYHYKQLPPIEIIDGQHRLWAFEDDSLEMDYELPVVAFHGLGLSWQAYLFYTINISPKKINRSLAFDLYPLLRNEDWLERFDGHSIYRETRAQELVDLLNAHPESPWNGWINMLGDNDGDKKVSQAAWIRSLIATFIRPADTTSTKIGGLFGAPIGEDKGILNWGKEEQAAVLVYFGSQLKDQISSQNPNWARDLPIVKNKVGDQNKDAFYHKDSLLNQDQGIRVILYILNDFLYINFEELDLERYGLQFAEGDVIEIVTQAISLLRGTKISEFLNGLAKEVVKFDWRSFNAVDSSESGLKFKKAAFRGSGGYRVLRMEVLDFLSESNDSKIKSQALKIKNLI